MNLINKIYAACDPDSPFGCVEPPANPDVFNKDPVTQTGSLMAVGIRLAFTFGAVACLIYLLWGAFDWIVSDGDKERIAKAQRKITYALVGIVFMMLSVGVFGIVADNVLGIVKVVDGGFVFSLPTYTP